MRIRIVTFHRALNCGAVLQTYALCTFLKGLGHRVEVLNYVPDWMRGAVSPIRAGHGINGFLLTPYRAIIRRCFDAFLKKNIPLTKLVRTADDISRLPECDLYITGSDQVWNPEITHGLDELYLLRFPTNAVKMSYAASYGMNNVPEEFAKAIAPALRDFRAVSVREHALQAALEKAGLSSVKTVLDPVFLLTQEQWEAVSGSAHMSDYVLIYTKSRITKEREIAHELAVRYGLQVIDTSAIIRKQHVNRTMPSIGPREFLGLIKNARFIVTNSFHATAFSVIFKKDFYVLAPGKYSVRQESLLNDVGLKSRIITELPSREYDRISYDAHMSDIQKLVHFSRSFLRESCHD